MSDFDLNNIPMSMNVRRTVVPTGTGIKVIYNMSDGTFIASIDIFTYSLAGQQAVPSLLSDLAQALSSQIIKPNPDEISKIVQQ